MEELIKTQDEYITLLEDQCGSMEKLMYVNHIKLSDEQVKRGVDLRKKILKLKKELKVK